MDRADNQRKVVKADFKRLEKLGNTGQQDKKERHNIFNPKRQQSHYGTSGYCRLHRAYKREVREKQRKALYRGGLGKPALQCSLRMGT